MRGQRCKKIMQVTEQQSVFLLFGYFLLFPLLHLKKSSSLKILCKSCTPFLCSEFECSPMHIWNIHPQLIVIYFCSAAFFDKTWQYRISTLFSLTDTIFIGSGYLQQVKIAIFFNNMLFTLSANSYRFYLHCIKIAGFSAIYTTYCK